MGEVDIEGEEEYVSMADRSDRSGRFLVVLDLELGLGKEGFAE